MKRSPINLNPNYETKTVPDFFVDMASFLGLRYFPSKTGGINRIALLFVMTNKLDPNDCIYIQTLFDLEDINEETFFINHHSNVENFDKEFKEKCFIPLITNAKPGINSFSSQMIFSNEESYYQFESVYADNTTKTNIFRKVNCPKSVWLQYSQLTYWLLCGHPIKPEIFLDKKFERAKLVKVTGMIYDGSTHVKSGLAKYIMAHFTLYWQDGIESGTFGFNLPYNSNKDSILIERHPMDSEKYMALYGSDEIAFPDKLFVISSPNKLAALLSKNDNENFYKIFTLDNEFIKRVDWLHWDKYIFINGGK